MHSFALFGNSMSISLNSIVVRPTVRFGFKHRAFLRDPSVSTYQSVVIPSKHKSSVHYDSLRVLEWDKLCDSVASFARTALGREATKAQLWSFNQSYEESLRLLEETNAAVEMHKHGGCSLDFSGIDVLLVQSAIRRARRSSPVDGSEAKAVVDLLQFAENLQITLKAAVKEDADWYKRFMPLTEVITRFVINGSLIKLIQQVIDEDGLIKDSASPALKQARNQVRLLERKMNQLMDNLIRKEGNEQSYAEVCNIEGRWCIKLGVDQITSFNGLLLPSLGGGSIVEPFSVVPLNDELQQARASVTKAETDVLSMLTSKIQMDLDDVELLLNSIIQLDVVNARATYSLSFGGVCPKVVLPGGDDSSAAYLSGCKSSNAPFLNKREWVLFLPKAYHPLLLQQHRENLQKAKKELKEVRRVAEKKTVEKQKEKNISMLHSKVAVLEQAHPVPVDFLIEQKTRVVIITGPNTGGKTICLKTIGLAALMARSGLHVLASESAQIPWFDSVFADIGDEQSLAQSLSTFSGHLKQISDIRSQSTSQSLVLLDEVGAGTNPLEGAALGISVLESFAETGALLTIATTHHGELKTLKYSNNAFDNACMEFDEVNLKPTYKILWGVPGRSNAINIAERLGLPSLVVEKARELYGTASAEIDEVIIDMERLKQEFQELLAEAEHHLLCSKGLYENLLVAERKIMGHEIDDRSKKIRLITEAASMARSILHKKVRQVRASTIQPTHPIKTQHKSKQTLAVKSQQTAMEEETKYSLGSKENTTPPVEGVKKSPSGKLKAPKVGDMVHVPSLGKEVKVVKVDELKEEILVQAGIMKLKLRMVDVQR